MMPSAFFSFFFYVLLVSKSQCLFYKITLTMPGELTTTDGRVGLFAHG